MSSDESTVEEATHRPCYRVSVLLWRRDLDAIMEIIDAERYSLQSGYSTRGSVPMPRFRQDRKLGYFKGVSPAAENIGLTRRQPVSNLPLVFYDEKWLTERSEEYIEQVLCVSKQAYDWVLQVVQSHSIQKVSGA